MYHIYVYIYICIYQDASPKITLVWNNPADASSPRVLGAVRQRFAEQQMHMERMWQARKSQVACLGLPDVGAL